MTGDVRDTPPTTVLKLAYRGCALVVTIDDPATRNAMSDALLADFEAVFATYRESPDIRALVIRGNERVFCAGADLGGDTLSGAADDLRQKTLALSERGARLYEGLDAFPKPVIVIVEGAAMGGGFGMTACADIVLAGPGAKFALSEVKLGLVPAQIAPFVVARIGVAVTRRLALTARRVDATEAADFGLVDEVLPNGAALDHRLDAILDDIQLCAPRALAATKSLLRGLSGSDAATFAKHAATVFTDAFLDEGAEGITAFKEKRAPAWSISA